MSIVGIDNDLRSYFFEIEASTAWKAEELKGKIHHYKHHSIDIRNNEKVFELFGDLGRDISLIVHAAAQPSHDWAAKEPFTDFTVNANGTLVMLEATRRYCPDAVFIFTSTNKVYGDRPNSLPLAEMDTRWEIDSNHPYFNGIDENMPIDDSMHSLFGVSKAAADLLAQQLLDAGGNRSHRRDIGEEHPFLDFRQGPHGRSHLVDQRCLKVSTALSGMELRL